MATRQLQLNQTLRRFYDKPVAKVSLELFFSIIGVIFFAIFAIRPTLVTMSDLVKEIQDKEELNQRLAQKIAALSTVQGEYFGLQERLAILDKAIPSTPKFEEAMLIIEKIASEQKLIIVSLEAKEIPKETAEAGNFADKVRVSKPVTLSVIGDYTAIRQFIDNIRTTQREISVDSIVFNLSDERGVKKLRANITMSIHYFSIQKEAPKASPVPRR